MAEQLKSIAEARENLSTLSKDAHGKMDRFVITNQGKPQSVLIGYHDYQSMRASEELLLRPGALASIGRGLEQVERGQMLTPEQVKAALKGGRTSASEPVSTEQLPNEQEVTRLVRQLRQDSISSLDPARLARNSEPGKIDSSVARRLKLKSEQRKQRKSDLSTNPAPQPDRHSRRLNKVVDSATARGKGLTPR
jgi:PHD/YefM family antitoxin component YafN of YafNO toxin-antitoxin module